MAGIFSLGSRGRRGEEEDNQENNNIHPPPPPPPEFWYNNTHKNDDSVGGVSGVGGISGYRGFEIWNHHQQQHHHHQFLPLQQDLYTGVALGVGPSTVVSSDENGSEYVAGSVSCHDCGNQAKKDCPHARCRTCCKSRGFDCQTHVKSTWVPAARRRERQQQQLQQAAQKSQHQYGDLNNSQIPNSVLACARLPTNPSLTVHGAGLHDELSFPAVVNAPAEFRCVRVTSAVDDSEEEYAYSTAVNIGGHIFRGILYNYGHDVNNNYMPVGNTTSTVAEAAALPLNLISAVPRELVDPTSISMYAAPLNSFMPSSSTQFYPNPRS